MSLAERLLEELEKDPRAKKRLAELLVVEPDVRLAMINALMAEVATRRDLGELRAEASRNFRWTMGTILVVWGATVIPILLRLVGAI